MLKIYGSDLSSPSNKVRFVANYLGIPYEYIRISIRNKENKTEAFLKMNPAGKVPTIDDDGFYLFESGTICKYLCEKHKSNLYPSELRQKAIVDQWIDFIVIHINAAMGRVLFNRVFAPITKAEVDEKSLECGLKFLDQYLPVVESQLVKNKYIVGDQLTLADLTL